MYQIIDMIEKQGLTHFEVLGDGKLPTRKDVAIFNPENGKLIEIENMNTNVLKIFNIIETTGCIERV